MHRQLLFALMAASLVTSACAAADPLEVSFLRLDTPAADEPYGVIATPPLPTTAPQIDFDPGSAIASIDAAIIADLTADQLTFRDGFNNDVIAQVPVAPNTELRAVSADGSRAALFEEIEQDGARVSRITSLVLNGIDISVTEYELAGLVEPEAFSTDGTALFVIDHQRSDTPGAYRVRPLDLATGELQTIVGPQKVPFTDDMNGTGRRQIWSPDGTRLYTLYIRQTHHHHDDGPDHPHGEQGTDGFVHVLDLDDEWAFCLDLPSAFGAGDLDTTALAVSPDGAELAVADMNAGQIAFASTVDLTVIRVVDLPDLDVTGQLQLGLTQNHVVLGWDGQVQWLKRDTLKPATNDAQEVPGRLLGFTSSPAGVLAWISGARARPLTEPAL